MPRKPTAEEHTQAYEYWVAKAERALDDQKNRIVEIKREIENEFTDTGRQLGTHTYNSIASYRINNDAEIKSCQNNIDHALAWATAYGLGALIAQAR